ncbi:MAG: hypothetical protein WDO14_06070 [Bacteroidota bacterium]
MKPLFEEKQRYSQWWLWAIIGSSALLVMGIFLHALYVQLILGTQWGETPMSNEALIAFSLFNISAMVLMLVVFFNAVLEITVDRGGISYKYFPIIRTPRRIEREHIQAYEVKKYFLKGYGIRRDFRGNRTINVKGHMGVEITTHDGKRLLLGTQKPEEFFQALHAMKKGIAHQ